MTDGLSADVKRHLARVYALVAACSLVSAGTCALLVTLVPWVAPYTYIVAVVSILGLIAVATAFARTPTKHNVTRFALLAAVCSFSGACLVFFCTVVLSVEGWGLTTMLVMTSLIFASFSVAAILTPPHKTLKMYKVALLLASVTLTVFSVVLASFNTFVCSGVLQFICLFTVLALFSLSTAWRSEAIIRTASEGDCDLAGDAARLFSDVLLSGIINRCLSKRSDEEEPLLR